MIATELVSIVSNNIIELKGNCKITMINHSSHLFVCRILEQSFKTWFCINIFIIIWEIEESDLESLSFLSLFFFNLPEQVMNSPKIIQFLLLIKLRVNFIFWIRSCLHYFVLFKPFNCINDVLECYGLS